MSDRMKTVGLIAAAVVAIGVASVLDAAGSSYDMSGSSNRPGGFESKLRYLESSMSASPAVADASRD